jgi:hypothetical protein
MMLSEYFCVYPLEMASPTMMSRRRRSQYILLRFLMKASPNVGVEYVLETTLSLKTFLPMLAPDVDSITAKYRMNITPPSNANPPKKNANGVTEPRNKNGIAMMMTSTKAAVKTMTASMMKATNLSTQYC